MSEPQNPNILHLQRCTLRKHQILTFEKLEVERVWHFLNNVVSKFSANCLFDYSTNHFISYFSTVHRYAHITSAQYCCLVSASMCAKPPRTSAFIRDLCTELDSRWRGGLRLANCFARFHQLSHCTTMFALSRRGGRGSVRVCGVVGSDVTLQQSARAPALIDDLMPP